MKTKNRNFRISHSTPLEKLWKSNKIINYKLLVAADLYVQDYLISIQDNMAKCNYDGTPINIKSLKNPAKEPSQKQIDCSKRINAIKRILNKYSFYDQKTLKKHYNKRYVKLIEYFLEKNFPIRQISITMGMNHRKIKEGVLEGFEIILDFYEKKTKKDIDIVSQ